MIGHLCHKAMEILTCQDAKFGFPPPPRVADLVPTRERKMSKTSLHWFVTTVVVTRNGHHSTYPIDRLVRIPESPSAGTGAAKISASLANTIPQVSLCPLREESFGR